MFIVGKIRLPAVVPGIVLALSLAAPGIFAAPPPAAAQDIRAAVIRVDYPSLLPLSRLDLPAGDRGIAGARLATDDNRTTGQFMGQSYDTREMSVPPEEALAAFRSLMDEGLRLVVIIAESEDLLAMAVFTQDAAKHDVVVAADASDVFAEYLPYHVWEAAPVAGSAGLRPLTWAPTHESWGATQMQTRFEELAGRTMTDLDYQTWLSLRVLGEAVTRTGSADPATLRDYILSEDFELAAFKGVPITVRPWNGQLRQPILLSNGRMTVSVSPQEGFLHEVSPLDTLGLDRPESECTAFVGGN